MPILHIAGYKFLALKELSTLKQALRARCEQAGLLGTILLSEEGININLSGLEPEMRAFQAYLAASDFFSGMRFHETPVEVHPYRQLKIKIKPEIITMRQQQLVHPETVRAPSLPPAELKQWLDEQRDFVLLDTRNEYEVACGTFVGAVNPHINHFSEFPASVEALPRDKPVVMFCTGGIRCEKAALYMKQQGFNDVYQLDGGILGYFTQVGAAHYQGDCFVFDDRRAAAPNTSA